jgi:D-amino-acid dehydrogenase
MRTCDVIVVGGGIVGAAAACHLARAGAATLLVDRGDAGRATDAGAGILSLAGEIDHPDPVTRFAARAAADYPGLIERLVAEDAGETGYAVCGTLMVAVDEDEAAAFDARSRVGRLAGSREGQWLVLTPEEAREIFPPLGRLHGALHSRHGARVDGRLLAAALRRAGERHGLKPASGEAVLAIEGGRVAGIRLEGERIAARDVVLAAGAWSRALAAPAGIEVPVAPQRGQIVHLDVEGADTGRWPVVLPFVGDHYMVAWDDQRIAVGATRETGSGFAARTTVAGVMAVLAEATRLAPGLGDAGIREIRVGLRPASADGLPILGAVPGVPGLHLATGHGPRGLQLGPFSGQAVARAITEGDPGVDLSPFALERFTRKASR